mmetsp:Transcript_16428/g.14110  ORF Transcript_16428/g.14110 Transcript_16428/m.14110 type:complete len:118 (-) Transcript_16428:424-777(-)
MEIKTNSQFKKSFPTTNVHPVYYKIGSMELVLYVLYENNPYGTDVKEFKMVGVDVKTKEIKNISMSPILPLDSKLLKNIKKFTGNEYFPCNMGDTPLEKFLVKLFRNDGEYTVEFDI